MLIEAAVYVDYKTDTCLKLVQMNNDNFYNNRNRNEVAIRQQ